MKVFRNLAAITLFFLAMQVFASGDNKFELSELKSAIDSGNTEVVVEQINLGKHEQYKKEVNSYIVWLWKERFSKDKIVLEDELVLINIGDFISQANKNNFIDAKIDSVLKLARKLIRSTNKRIASIAIAILSRSSDSNDIDKLFAIIEKSESKYLFDASVMSLISNCNGEQNNRLSRIKGLSKDKRDYIKSSISDFASMGLCEGISS